MGATDSKLAFRKGVFRLYEERNIPVSADDYWTCFWTLPETADDIYSLIGANDIRKIRDVAKENMETLIDKLIERIDTIVNAPSFPSAQYPVHHLINCFRILTRIMPYIFESTEHGEWEDQFFWTPRTVERLIPTTSLQDQQIKGTFEEQQESTTSSSDTMDQKRIIEYDTLKPRGELLLNLVIQCLYLIGFTLPLTVTNTKEENSRVVYAIWEDGIGSSTSLGTSRDIDMNRIEVLRLLTVLFSKSMYTSPSHTLAKEDLWLNHVVTKTERKVILVLLCSFMNTACKYDPIGWGVPYNHIMVADPREQLVAMCLRVLLILLDYRSPHAVEVMHELDQQQQQRQHSLAGTATEQMIGDITTSSTITLTAKNNNGDHPSSPDTSNNVQEETPAVLVPTSPTSTEIQSILSSVEEINDTHDNPFKHYLSKLHRPSDFKFLVDGIHRILLNPLQATNTYLPRSTKRVQCTSEMLMLCWRLMECNQRFKNYMTETNHALDLLVVLIYYSVESKSNITQVGVVRMCAFILQTLSSEREFGIKLNTVFNGHSALPSIARLPAFHGTYGDYLVVSIVNLIASTHGGLSSLYPAFILTIANVSPYLKNLSVASASKLITLFNSVSSPGFMLADDSNHRLTGYMLEIFNNIIQYHFANNPNVIYAIVRNHTRFEKLFNFTLSSGLAEIEHHRRLKEEKRQSISSEAPVNNSDHPTVNDDTKTTPSSSSSTSSLERQQVTSPSSSSSSSLGQMYTFQKFSPTEEWVSLWFPQFPVETIRVLLDYLVPLVEEKCTTEGLTTDAQVLEFLRSVTLVGILPQRHAIFIRKFQWGEALVIWFRSMLWGQAYISSMHTLVSPWNGTLIRLFQIKHEIPSSPSQQQQKRSTTSPPPPATIEQTSTTVDTTDSASISSPVAK